MLRGIPVRGADLTVDSTMLWVGAGLALIAAVLLAFVPRLRRRHFDGIGVSNTRVGMSGSTNGRLRIFAITQIAASFLLLAGASVLVKTLITLQLAQSGLDTDHVLAMDMPVMSYGDAGADWRVLSRSYPAHFGTAWSGQSGGRMVVPWRDAGNFGPECSSPLRAAITAPKKKIRAHNFAPFRQDFLRLWACRLSPGVISTTRTGSPANKW